MRLLVKYWWDMFRVLFSIVPSLVVLKEGAGKSRGYVGVLRDAFGPEFKEGLDGSLFENSSMIRVILPVRQDIVDRGEVWARFKSDVDVRLRTARGSLMFSDEELRCEYQSNGGDDGVNMVLVASKHHTKKIGELERSNVVNLAVGFKRMMDVGYR